MASEPTTNINNDITDEDRLYSTSTDSRFMAKQDSQISDDVTSFMLGTTKTNNTKLDPARNISSEPITETTVLPDSETIRQAEPTELLSPMSQLFRQAFTQSRGQSANIIALSEEFGVSPSEIQEDYGKYSKEAGFDEKVTTKKLAESIATPFAAPAIIGAIATNPVAAGVSIGTFAAFDEIEDFVITKIQDEDYKARGHKSISDLLPDDYSAAVKDTVDIIEFAGKMYGAAYAGAAIAPKARKLINEFTTKITETYNLPNKVFIPAEKVRSVFQDGGKLTADEIELIKSANMDAAAYKKAIRDGIDIEIPITKVIEIADKPYWAAMKKSVGLKPYAERFEVPAGTPRSQAPVRGLLESPEQAAKAAAKKAKEVSSARKDGKGIEAGGEEEGFIQEATGRIRLWSDAQARMEAQKPKEVDYSALIGKKTRPLVQAMDDTYEPSIFINGDSNLTQELPKRAININLQKIGTSDDVKSVIDRVSNVYRPQIQEARRGTITNEQAAALADEINMPVDKLLARQTGDAFNAENIIAARQVLATSAENLHSLAQTASRADASDIDKIAFRKALSTHAAIQLQVSGLTAEAGRALNAFKITVEGKDAIAKQIKELMDSSGGPEVTDQMVNDIANMSDIKSINSYAKKTNNASVLDMLLEARYAAMLSSPKTHVVNMLGNTLFTTWQIPERFLSTAIGKLTPGKDVVELGEAEEFAFGMMQGLKESMVMAGKVLRTGESISPITDKAEFHRQRAISADNVFDLPGLRQASETFPKVTSSIGKGIDFFGEYVVGMPTRMLMTSDAFFKGVSGRMQLNAEAYRAARAEGLKDAELATRIQEIKENPPEDILLRSADFADYATFTNKLEGSLGKMINATLQKNPYLKLVVPFVRTPLNIFYASMERSPFAPMMSSFRADIQAGGTKRDLALAKMSMGTMLQLSVMQLISDGTITGGGPADTKLKQMKRNTGWQPYSLKVGDTYYQYNRLEPLSTLIGMSADFYEVIGESSEIDEDQTAMIASSLVMATIKNITSKTYLQGLTDIFEVASDPERYGPRYLSSFAGSFIPAASRAAARYTDPQLRDAKSAIDQMRAKIPGYSDNLPPRRNVWGEPILLTGGVTAEIISPIYPSKAVDDPASEEVYRLRLPLSMPRREIRGVDLKPDEFSRYVELAGNGLKGPDGNGFKDSIDELIKTPMYQSWPDEMKREVIVNMQNKYKRAAQAQMLTEFPDIMMEVEDMATERYNSLTQ